MSFRQSVGTLFAGLTVVGAASAAEPVVSKIAVLHDGRILVDGSPVDGPTLDSRLSALAKAHGAIWYYREGVGAEPSGAQAQAIESVLSRVVRARLPISLSTKPDFSDVVDQNGHSVARPHQ
jgi:hypothetical protein